jgi:type IV pilus assembly protein PilM
MSEDEAQEAVKWEIEASIPLSVDQVYFDWQFLDQKDGKQNVLTVAVAKNAIDELIKTVSLAGFSVYGIEMESIASVRSLIPQKAKMEEAFLIVDMGAEKTSFIITESNIPYFTSSIPFSSNVITDSIADILNVSKEEAERIKTSRGIEHSFENNSIFNSIKPFLENLSVELQKTINFYQDMSKSQTKVNRIIISGGGANLKGLVQYLTARLAMEVILGDPWVNLNLGKNLPIVSRENSIRYATAIGLAMRK